jgi:hypothetical protein
MIVNSDRENAFGSFLTDHVLIEFSEEFRGCRHFLT